MTGVDGAAFKTRMAELDRKFEQDMNTAAARWDASMKEADTHWNKWQRRLSIFLIVFDLLVIATVSAIWWFCGSLIGIFSFHSENLGFGIGGAVSFIVLISFLLWLFRELWLPMWWTALGQYERADKEG
jgi:hypothetical protein